VGVQSQLRNHFESSRGLPGPARWLFDRGISNTREVIVQTDEQARRMRDTFGRLPTVIPNGFHPATEPPLPHDEREFFLWIGRLADEQKRPHQFLDLADRLPESRLLRMTRRTNINGTATGEQTGKRELSWIYPAIEIHGQYCCILTVVNTQSTRCSRTRFSKHGDMEYRS